MYKVHYDFKHANGYSDLEINQKRSILKKIILTYLIKTHKILLNQVGFNHT
ncbi:hypothetical protein [Candidatus Profftia sp. (ex Adelges kitamiensis)]|uniref:hypothetical protein n=1 Tax=Candidatus Profftia sp. (ex Adelges kitamiensis) TaxID=2864218 RepID=UPI002A4E2CFC|nr:hypothetical protein [Candidatus Profftia sp. (ex Adelges kitamiensis)]